VTSPAHKVWSPWGLVGLAIVALVRRLAGILYAMWRDGTAFEPRRPVKGTAE